MEALHGERSVEVRDARHDVVGKLGAIRAGCAQERVVKDVLQVIT